MKYYIAGAEGRMGQSLVRLLKEDSKVVVPIDNQTSLKSLVTDGAGTVIDFSSPLFFDEILEWSANNNLHFVSGTTGLSSDQFQKLSEAGKKIPVLWASNMSIGIAFVNKLLKQFSELSKDFDFQVEETHHRYKKDRPSGTGITIQENLKTAVKKELPEVLSIRGGGIFGNHKVWAMSEDETIMLEHNALNRDVFSRGAIRCAQWLENKSAGEYTIEMVLDA